MTTTDEGERDRQQYYWQQNGQHNVRLDAFGIQLWVRFHHTEHETRLYGDVFKR